MNILVLSAHSLSLDRRIISQINALVEYGYDVTLLSIPVYDDCSNLIDSRVKRILPFIPRTRNQNVFMFKQLGRKYLPELALMLMRLYRTKFYFTNYFLQRVPPQKYDVIHAHDLNTIPAAITIKNKFSPHSKIIYDAHELYPYQFSSKIEEKFWIMLEKRSMPFVETIITVNESCKLQFEKTFSPCPPVNIIYNSYSFEPQEEESKDIKQYFPNKELPICIFQGGISSGRNLENLVKAFAQLGEVCNLLVVGRGNVLDNLKNIAVKDNAANIFFMNWVAQDKLPGILKQVSFGVIPYISDNKLNNVYCTPNKLFEFISFKVPILANNLPEIQRIIKKYEIGLIFDLTSITSIQEAVKQIISTKFPASNFINAEVDLGWEAQKKVLLTIYKN